MTTGSLIGHTLVSLRLAFVEIETITTGQRDRVEPVAAQVGDLYISGHLQFGPVIRTMNRAIYHRVYQSF